MINKDHSFGKDNAEDFLLQYPATGSVRNELPGQSVYLQSPGDGEAGEHFRSRKTVGKFREAVFCIIGEGGNLVPMRPEINDGTQKWAGVDHAFLRDKLRENKNNKTSPPELPLVS